MPAKVEYTRVKKTCAFILAVLYFNFSVGATLHQHYCMGELVGTSLFDMRDDECGKCGMKKHTEASKNCCKDVSIVIKVGDSHTFSQPVYDIHSFTYILPDIYFVTADLSIPKGKTENSYRAHSPPLQKNPLFIQFGNFRI